MIEAIGAIKHWQQANFLVPAPKISSASIIMVIIITKKSENQDIHKS
jgi:hypothetical protein